VIAERASHPNDKSYTCQLLVGGVDAIGVKIIEEAAEVVEAAHESGPEGRAHFVHEAADAIYHLLVLLQHKQVTLADVEAELAQRFGVSGLDEKASRSANPATAGP
jgi:phosphoribosyl-ATP pyrophosphohydrolase